MNIETDHKNWVVMSYRGTRSHPSLLPPSLVELCTFVLSFSSFFCSWRVSLKCSTNWLGKPQVRGRFGAHLTWHTRPHSVVQKFKKLSAQTRKRRFNGLWISANAKWGGCWEPSHARSKFTPANRHNKKGKTYRHSEMRVAQSVECLGKWHTWWRACSEHSQTWRNKNEHALFNGPSRAICRICSVIN